MSAAVELFHLFSFSHLFKEHLLKIIIRCTITRLREVVVDGFLSVVLGVDAITPVAIGVLEVGGILSGDVESME